MKIYLRQPENFHPETLKFYQDNFEIVEKSEDAKVIVINDFQPIETDKIVAVNVTAPDFVKAPEIMSLRGEDLSDLTAVAELCLGMAIFCTRHFKRQEIREKTLLIIGYGRIGAQFDKYASHLGVNVITHEDYEEIGHLMGVLPVSDIVSLHITSDENNRNFMDKSKFKKMKEGAIFLNSARPWLVEEEALKWALDNKLGGAWIDFILPFKHKKLTMTDHLGGSTVESRKKSEMIIARKLLKIYGPK